MTVFGFETRNEIEFLVSSVSGKRKRKYKRKRAFPEKWKRNKMQNIVSYATLVETVLNSEGRTWS